MLKDCIGFILNKNEYEKVIKTVGLLKEIKEDSDEKDVTNEINNLLQNMSNFPIPFKYINGICEIVKFDWSEENFIQKIKI